MKNWKNAEIVFSELNYAFPYLIIRNFEGFYDSVLLDHHADIDILCYKRDRKSIVRFLAAEPRLGYDDGIHYHFQIKGNRIPLDIRYVGDGYYDKRWEKDMLKNRIMDPRGFYHMEPEHYFWSLLYHALYHKGTLTEEYYLRLKEMNPNLFPSSQKQLEVKLRDYMCKHRYYYTIAKDRYLWYHFTDCCKGRIRPFFLYSAKRLISMCHEYLMQIIS